jgi:hypothetical protein
VNSEEIPKIIHAVLGAQPSEVPVVLVAARPISIS